MSSDNNILSFLKKKENFKYILLAVVALFILIVSMGLDTQDKKISYESDEAAVEARLSELCSSVKGVGRCRVMVCLEYDTQKYSSQQRTYRVSAVSVVCDGGDKESVRAALSELIGSLYGIGANRISVHELS